MSTDLTNEISTTKDDLIEAYREEVSILKKIIEVKDKKIELFEKHIEDYKKLIDISVSYTERALKLK